ncbi:MAG TPA: multiheme c-type cytochrome [Thermodesulfovibrionia bacterium]|nr:multiheme c-type cytochrome [Thermodesulfovibrionia bacterium]
MKIKCIVFFVFLFLLTDSNSFAAKEEKNSKPCIQCHKEATPAVVEQFSSGKMGLSGMDCSACHGEGHQKGQEDKGLAEFPTHETCKTCHPVQAEQNSSGKHALGWEAMKVMPFMENQPEVAVEKGDSGCSMCHKIGLITREDKTRPGAAACTSCHSMHVFSKKEASDPRTCQSCHSGPRHDQWTMWSDSRHGTLWQIHGDKNSHAPTCQTCHMPEGNHRVMTAWGFLAIRLPEDNKTWLEDRVVILQALGIFDEQGNPASRFGFIEKHKMARLTKADFDKERQNMINICSKCHSASLAENTFKSSELIIREADKLMAEAIKIVQALYRDDILEKPEKWKTAPDLLQCYEATSSVEQTLYKMFFNYRMHTVQGAFHLNANDMQWNGWALMKESLTRIRDEDKRLRAEHRLQL